MHCSTTGSPVRSVSGKTTGIFMKLVYMAKLQETSEDGIRHSRAVVVRNTAPLA